MFNRRKFLAFLGVAPIAAKIAPAAAADAGEEYAVLGEQAWERTAGLREELTDVIYNITPIDSPFTSIIYGKRAMADFMSHPRWETDYLEDDDGETRT